jgi:hypothetical protein
VAGDLARALRVAIEGGEWAPLLGMLSGLVQHGWLLAHSARVHPDPAETAWGCEELRWWIPRIRLALERLGVAPA